MTRKDYKIIAAALNRAALDDTVDRRALERVIAELASALKSDNARFDRERFRAAVYAGAGR